MTRWRARWRRWLLSGSRTAHEARRVLYHGDSVQCPCCGTRSRRFMADYWRRDAICRGCYSEERHRALRLFLTDWFSTEASPRVLHFAPEGCLRPWLESLSSVAYLTADVVRSKAELQVDMTALGVSDGSFDLVIASHVLEHVSDDGVAMRELHRALRPGGTALVMVPRDATRSVTLEDPSICTPEARQAAYWQSDHVRLYGADLPDRLRGAGFSVKMVRPSLQVAPSDVRRFGLEADPALLEHYPSAPPDEIYVATR